MNILLTVPSLSPEFGGPAAKVEPLAAVLRDAGHNVNVLGAGRAQGAIGLGRVFSFHETPMPARRRPIAHLVRRADVVHVIGYRDPVGTMAAFSARRYNVPYVLEPVGMNRRRLRSQHLKRAYDLGPGRLVMKHAARVIATSRLERDELIKDGVTEERIRIRPNGVDVSVLLPLPPRGVFRSANGIPDAAPLVLALGRIARTKGLLFLVEAIAQAADVWCAIAGPDAQDGTLPRLDDAMRLRDLTGRLRLLPAGIWSTEKAQAFSDADVFVLASATESFGLAAAEAACIGLPVAVSEGTGVKEWLNPESTRVVTYGAADELASAIRDLLDRGARTAAADAAPMLRSTLSWSAMVDQQTAVYEEAVSHARRR
jgi:glycosyltransferase involved in cell wall biosynthesis